MSRDRYVLVKGSSGLGNRIGCVMTGILYARLTGRRLIVDWSDKIYSNDRRNVFHHFLQCSMYKPGDEVPHTDSVNPSIWRGHLGRSMYYMAKRYAESRDLK